LEEHEHFDVKIPSVVAAELYYGASKSEKRSYNIARFEKFISVYEIVPFALSAARYYGDIRADLERKGQMIGWNDLIIAAIVLANEGLLVTHNTGEFSRIDNIDLEDWTIS
jgi:tRNA(fMet)-specific endonuclease VapC